MYTIFLNILITIFNLSNVGKNIELCIAKYFPKYSNSFKMMIVTT